MTDEPDGTDSARSMAFLQAQHESERDAARDVHVLITATLAVAAVFVTQLPFDELVGLPLFFRILMLAGITMLLASAASFFFYRNRPGAAVLLTSADDALAFDGRAEASGARGLVLKRCLAATPLERFWPAP